MKIVPRIADMEKLAIMVLKRFYYHNNDWDCNICKTN